MALEPAKLSEFTMTGSLGAGTTAKVYEAKHIATGRPVAIKVMEESAQSAEMRERFAREAILLSGVDSRHVCKIVGFGFDKGKPFLVLERLHGETLDAKLRRDGPVPAPIALRWIEQLIVGIRDCHDTNVIHRDIKPSNIFIHHDGFEETLKVIDFGVARLRELTDDPASSITTTNHLIGSMGYMAPEQFRNAKLVGFPADLYAVGIVVYRTLTGRLPFVSRSLEAVIRMKSEQVVPAISAMPGMLQSPVLDGFVRKATQREAHARFQNAREMLEAWWNVMSALEEQGSVRMQPSRPLPSQPRIPRPIPPSVPVLIPAPVSSHRTHPGPPTVPHSAESTIRRGSDHPWDDVPHTERSPEGGPYDETAGYIEGGAPDDPFDLPTRNDPNLKKLVERELALQKARKERS